MRRRRCFAVLTLFAFLCFVPAVRADGDNHVRAVRLSDVEGDVQILPGPETQFEAAFQNMPLVEGSRLEAGSDGRVEIELEDGSVARLTPNTSLNVNRLARSASGTAETELEVLSGLAYFEGGAGSGQYAIRIGQALVTPLQGASFRINLDGNPAALAVFAGSVRVTSDDVPAADVHSGETMTLDRDDLSRHEVTEEVQSDSWDQWNVDRDQELAALEAKESAQTTGRQGAGWSDLDAYGDWYAVAGYGNVWAPFGAGPGWDPYGLGYWGYYPGSGAVWISAYAWGWLPYRCGQWNYFDSFGWGWLPGSCGRGGYLLNGIFVGQTPGGYIRPRRIWNNPPSHKHHTVVVVNRGGEASYLPPFHHGPGRGRAIIAGQAVDPLPKIARTQLDETQGAASHISVRHSAENWRPPAAAAPERPAQPAEPTLAGSGSGEPAGGPRKTYVPGSGSGSGSGSVSASRPLPNPPPGAGAPSGVPAAPVFTPRPSSPPPARPAQPSQPSRPSSPPPSFHGGGGGSMGGGHSSSSGGSHK